MWASTNKCLVSLSKANPVNGLFTLAESDPKTDMDSIKFYYHYISVSVYTSIQFGLGLLVEFGLSRCEHTIRQDGATS